MRMHRQGAAAIAVMLGVTGSALSGDPTSSAATAQEVPQAQVVLRPAQVQGEISPLLYGANHRYAYDGFGMWDSENHRAYPTFVEQVKEAGITAIRYPGGTIANRFRWKESIGPVDQREPSPHGGGIREPITAEFGPDEFGHLLEQTNATGSVVVNFATADGSEAADWVEYMTASVGTNPRGGTAWAEVRAANGHPEPYDIPYWEVANEPQNSGQRYWRAGESELSEAELYASGGSTRFTGQRVVTPIDYRDSAAVSDGTAEQVFHVAYAPVTPGSQTVYVAGQAWRQVEDLAAAGSEDVYSFDPDSGAITFGDGTHGNIPADGAVVTVDYTSGPHDGFADFYREMKAANPDVKVCIGDGAPDFVAAMGSDKPYDCAVTHPYVGGGQVPGTLPLDEFRGRFLAQADDRVRAVGNVKARIEEQVGTERAQSIEIVVSEYGHLASSNPVEETHYHRSLDEGLYNAEFLRETIELGGVSVAMRHALVDYVFEEAPPGSTNVGAPDNAIIAGPGPDTVPQAQAHVFSLFTNIMGDTSVASTVIGSPARALGNGDTLQSLTSVASVDDDGALYAIVINRDAEQDITAEVLPVEYRQRGIAQVWTVDGPSYLSFNTPEDPDQVTLDKKSVVVGAGAFDYTFPAHSVTALKLPGRVVETSLSATMDAPEDVTAGGQFDVMATVGNDGEEESGGELRLHVPDGWRVEPASTRYESEAGTTTSHTFTVSVPEGTETGPYLLGLTTYGPGNFVADTSEASVVVVDACPEDPRLAEPVFTDTFDNDPVGASPVGYNVTGPEDGVTVADTDDGRRVLALQRTSPGSQLIAGVRPFQSASGDLRVTARVRPSQTDGALGVHLLDANGRPVARLSLANNGNVAYTNGANFVNSPVPYDEGRWHDLEATLDSSTDTYQVCFGGRLVASDAALERPSATAERIRVQIPTNSNGVGRFEFDEIRGTQLREE